MESCNPEFSGVDIADSSSRWKPPTYPQNFGHSPIS
jgi:hypothetical protein